MNKLEEFLKPTKFKVLTSFMICIFSCLFIPILLFVLLINGNDLVRIIVDRVTLYFFNSGNSIFFLVTIFLIFFFVYCAIIYFFTCIVMGLFKRSQN